MRQSERVHPISARPKMTGNFSFQPSKSIRNNLKVSETHPKLIFVQKFDWTIVCPFAISSCCNSNIMIYCKKLWQSISIEKAIAIDWIKILQSKIIVILECMNCYIRAFACSRQWDYFLNKIFQYIYMNAISGPATLNKQSLITCRSTFVLTNDDKLLFSPDEVKTMHRKKHVVQLHTKHSREMIYIPREWDWRDSKREYGV